MVNLKGLDILGSAKAGAPERTKPSFARSANKESSFKEVLGQSEQKVETGKKEISERSTSKGDQQKQQDRQDSAMDSATEKRVERSSNQMPAKSDTMSEVKAADAEIAQVNANALPGAPNPTPISKGGPEFIGSVPGMMPIKNSGVGISKINSEEGVDSLTRRVVWNDFLRKMNEELGVTADKVLEAFSTLTEEELSAPPQENVDKLVMALGLNPQQNETAQKLFTDLIKKTQSKSLGAELASSATQINLSLMSQREVQRKQIQTSLDKMNSQFFMSRQGLAPKIPLGAEGALSEMPNQSKLGEEYIAAPELGLAPLPGSEGMPALELQQSQTSPTPNFDKLISQMQSATTQEQKEFAQAYKANQQAAQQAAPQATQQASQQNQTQSLAPAKSSLSDFSAKVLGGQEGSAAMNTGAKAVSSAPSHATEIANAVTNAFGNMQNRLGAESDDSQEELSDSEFSQEMPIDRSNLGSKIENGFSLNPAQPNSTVGQPAPAMAVPDLIQNARIMVRDGGGEMKVTLTPEGLGEVAMKVSVNNGRVNVQMITESDEAKKMIEKGLVDLKSSLQANNLSLDSIKVDTASTMGQQLEQQYRDAQKQQAHQFLENFRQDSQGWRRNFFEPPTAQLTRSQSQGSSTQGTPYYGGNSKRPGTRRLDLVA